MEELKSNKNHSFYYVLGRAIYLGENFGWQKPKVHEALREVEQLASSLAVSPFLLLNFSQFEGWRTILSGISNAEPENLPRSGSGSRRTP